jgi:glycosyltransferase involved in cell wall biosynthesis
MFSVIIPTYNDWERLLRCLDALDQQTLKKDQYEVIVVDNSENPTDSSDITLPDWVQLLHEPKPGSYTARNKGAKHATGEILAFTDSDCIPCRNWLSNAQEIFEDKNCDLVGGEIEIFPEDGGSKHIYIYEKYFGFRQKSRVPKGQSCTANTLVKRSVFYKAGKFNSKLKSFGDWEFSQRCLKRGFSIEYGSSVVVRHPARKSLETLIKRHLRHVYWGSIITRKNYQCGQLKVLLSSLKGALQRLFKHKPKVSTTYDRLVIWYIDLIKMAIQLYGNSMVLLKLKNPNKVRE